MSKTINVCLLFSSILLNQLMTSDVSFHWFKRVVFLSLLFILSRMDLLNLPISFFAGLISLVFGLFMKFGLWSFRDIKHSSWMFTRTLFAIVLSCFVRCFSLLSLLVLRFFYLLFCMWLWLNLSAIFWTVFFFQFIQICSFIGKC